MSYLHRNILLLRRKKGKVAVVSRYIRTSYS